MGAGAKAATPPDRALTPGARPHDQLSIEHD